jgi:hypothetical protein
MKQDGFLKKHCSETNLTILHLPESSRVDDKFQGRILNT